MSCFRLMDWCQSIIISLLGKMKAYWGHWHTCLILDSISTFVILNYDYLIQNLLLTISFKYGKISSLQIVERFLQNISIRHLSSFLFGKRSSSILDVRVMSNTLLLVKNNRSRHITRSKMSNHEKYPQYDGT